jgi:hypothetical protein
MFTSRVFNSVLGQRQMANDVLTILTFRRYSAELIDSIDKKIDSIVLHEDTQRFGDLLTQDELVETPDACSADWNMQYVGSKWCSILSNSLDDDPPKLTLISAWGPPLAGIVNMLRQSDASENELVQIMYLDEAYEFTGSIFYKGSAELDRWHLEWEDIVDLVAIQNLSLAESLREGQSLADEHDHDIVNSVVSEERSKFQERVISAYDQSMMG